MAMHTAHADCDCTNLQFDSQLLQPLCPSDKRADLLCEENLKEEKSASEHVVREF